MSKLRPSGMSKSDIELPLITKEELCSSLELPPGVHISPFYDFIHKEADDKRYREIDSCLSYVFFTDTLPLASSIRRRKTETTLKELPMPYFSYNIESKIYDLDQAWYSNQDPSKRSIIRATMTAFKPELIISFILLFFTCTGHLVSTMLLGSLINVITQYNLDINLENPINFQEVANRALLFSLVYFLAQSLETWLGYYDYIVGAKMRLAITGFLYKKLNCLSLNSLHELSTGKVMTVISNDLNDVDIGYGFIFPTIISPYNIGIGCYVMWGYFQWYTLVSMFCLVGFLALAIKLSNQSEIPRMTKNRCTDERVRSTNQLVEQIRIVKQYAWGKPFRKAIEVLRANEVVALLKIAAIEANGRTVTETSVYLCVLLTCIVYVTSGGVLNPEKVYTSMMILNFLKFWAILFFHFGRMFLVSLRVMKERIHDILNMKEVLALEETTRKYIRGTTDDNVILKSRSVDIDHPIVIEFIRFWAYPSTASYKPCLEDINFTIQAKTLTAIIGRTGCGKSSFLLSLLKEMAWTKGEINSKGSMAYVEQEPIVFPGTLRDNILFGKEFKKDFYKRVLEACCWNADFKTMPKKDFTVIGEKGVTLSGGQKARLSLARALYSEYDIYLLDDPLSAVDSQVAKHIFRHAIRGILGNKTVLLVTHHMRFTEEADVVVVLDEGKIQATGTFAELSSMRMDLTEVFKSPIKVQQEAKQEEIPSVNSFSNTDSRRSSMREMSILSRQEDPELDEEEEAQNIQEAASVTWQTYKDYLKVSGKYGTFYFLLFMYLLSQLFIFGFTRFLGYWAELQYKSPEDEYFNNSPYIATSVVLCLGIMFTYHIKISYTIKFLTDTNTKLHNQILAKLVKTVVSFFDYTPLGQIVNRFSGDIGILDKHNWEVVFDLLDGVIYVVFFLCYLCVVSFNMILPSLCIMYLVFKIKIYFTKPSIDLKKIDLATRSPIYTEITSTLSGLLIIRVYKQGGRFIRNFLNLVHSNSRAFLYNSRTTRSFMVALKLFLYLLTVFGLFIFLVMAYYSSLDSAVFGLTLLYLLEIANKSVATIRQTLFLDINMQSAQRLLEYRSLPQEPPSKMEQDAQIKASSDKIWPKQGEIKFNNVFLKYNNTNEPALRGVSFTITAGSKVGIVGRTGAGKTSILQALFRMVEIEDFAGSFIKIDNITTKELGLQFLRQNLSIIPQTPTLFNGTVRSNLDLFEQFTDAQIWKVLDSMNLKSKVMSLEKGLETTVSGESTAFSSGEKQLFCLARILLKRSKIVVLDEATANVDLETDQLIQVKIRQYLQDCTVVTIAHRLLSVADNDKIIVMERGVVVETGSPYELLVNTVGDSNISNIEGSFARMVQGSGGDVARQIFQIAKEKYYNKTTKGYSP